MLIVFRVSPQCGTTFSHISLLTYWGNTWITSCQFQTMFGTNGRPILVVAPRRWRVAVLSPVLKRESTNSPVSFCMWNGGGPIMTSQASKLFGPVIIIYKASGLVLLLIIQPFIVLHFYIKLFYCWFVSSSLYNIWRKPH